MTSSRCGATMPTKCAATASIEATSSRSLQQGFLQPEVAESAPRASARSPGSPRTVEARQVDSVVSDWLIEAGSVISPVDRDGTVRPNFRLLCATIEDRPGELTAVFDDRNPLRKSFFSLAPPSAKVGWIETASRITRQDASAFIRSLSV